MEAESILDCCKELCKQGALPVEMATDGDSTTHKFVQVGLIECKEMRMMGG
jgi:hypothetical protein